MPAMTEAKYILYLNAAQVFHFKAAGVGLHLRLVKLPGIPRYLRINKYVELRNFLISRTVLWIRNDLIRIRILPFKPGKLNMVPHQWANYKCI
jgi:hypothetical protein